jgi:hypothetical protein
VLQTLLLVGSSPVPFGLPQRLQPRDRLYRVALPPPVPIRAVLSATSTAGLSGRFPGVFGVDLLTDALPTRPKIALRRPFLPAPPDLGDLVRNPKTLVKSRFQRGRHLPWFDSHLFENCTSRANTLVRIERWSFAGPSLKGLPSSADRPGASGRCAAPSKDLARTPYEPLVPLLRAQRCAGLRLWLAEWGRGSADHHRPGLRRRWGRGQRDLRLRRRRLVQPGHLTRCRPQRDAASQPRLLGGSSRATGRPRSSIRTGWPRCARRRNHISLRRTIPAGMRTANAIQRLTQTRETRPGCGSAPLPRRH